jgi:AcrR family transcriptional regulator
VDIPVARPRSPGRPTGDAQAQRERLLDAALASFAEVGISASSLRTIAEQAGGTPALVNYYFGSKQKLVEALFEERLQPLFSQVAVELQQAAGNPLQLITIMVSNLNRVLIQNPALPPLWVREILCEGGQLRDLWVRRIGPILPARLAQYFTAAQKQGALNPDLNPGLLVVSLFGMVMLPHAAASLLKGVFPDVGLDEAALTKHTLALLERGLESPHAH